MSYTCILIFFYIILVVCCVHVITYSQKRADDNLKELKDCIKRRHNENSRPNK